eukprot:CAMPEP_0170620234 /NCGR_PEP_ID=MMETSP0224-20130122/27949_1 /TAXON_ID=285029 /ORGANISM="Togula jolla, Strain CCCM 725" /LENGTH=354 /DNA_ID=CAMNT_0010946393 /DNA_START=178 /DNA_END=1242 /DNA_ORIENTATION=-
MLRARRGRAALGVRMATATAEEALRADSGCCCCCCSERPRDVEGGRTSARLPPQLSGVLGEGLGSADLLPERLPRPGNGGRKAGDSSNEGEVTADPLDPARDLLGCEGADALGGLGGGVRARVSTSASPPPPQSFESPAVCGQSHERPAALPVIPSLNAPDGQAPLRIAAKEGPCQRRAAVRAHRQGLRPKRTSQAPLSAEKVPAAAVATLSSRSCGDAAKLRALPRFPEHLVEAPPPLSEATTLPSPMMSRGASAVAAMLQNGKGGQCPAECRHLAGENGAPASIAAAPDAPSNEEEEGSSASSIPRTCRTSDAAAAIESSAKRRLPGQMRSLRSLPGLRPQASGKDATAELG